MSWDEFLRSFLTVIMPAILGGGFFGAVVNAILESRRIEQVDRVEALAEAQQLALERSNNNENLLRELLFTQKREMRELEERWRGKFIEVEARYAKKCDDIEEDARQREEEYQAEIAMLRMELDRLRVLILRHGVDPNVVCGPDGGLLD